MRPIDEPIAAPPNRRRGRPAWELRRAITRASLPGSRAESEAVEGTLTSFVTARIRAMSAHLRIGIAVVEALLIVRCFARSGRSPGALDKAAAESMARRWEASRLPPVAQYVRLIRSLALFANFDQSDRGSPR